MGEKVGEGLVTHLYAPPAPNPGTSTCNTSTSAELSITCAAFWTAAADTSSTGTAPDHLRQLPQFIAKDFKDQLVQNRASVG